MSRSPDAAAMLDIRSTAILQDIVFQINPCAPGANKRRPSFQFYGPLVLEVEDKSGSKIRFGRQKDWVACMAAAIISGIILGVVHSFGLIIPLVSNSYGLGQIEAVIVAALTYTIIICFGPLSCFLIKKMGHRLTCMFGLLLFFVGLLLDAFQINRICFYVTHLLLMGFGGSFAYSAAMSSVVDHHRKYLPIALVIMSISSPIGTALIYTFSEMLLRLFPLTTSYQWMQITLAIIILVLIAATQLFPPRMPRKGKLPQHLKPRSQKVKDCIEESAKSSGATTDVSDPCQTPQPVENLDEDEKSCMCVIVIDVSVWTDMSFLLWALISVCALLTFYIPYLFLAKYMIENVRPDERERIVYLIWWVCLASLIGRLATIMGNDYTFIYNRLIFQGALLGSGILYLFVAKAKTFGWITIWALIVGTLEGIFTVVIPRVTLQTIPRKWMASSWSYIVVMHGFGLLIGPLIVITAWAGTGGFYGLGFVVIGIIQIIGGLLAFLLPNEEEEDSAVSGKQQLPPAAPTKPDSYYFGPNSYSKRLAEYNSTYGSPCSGGGSGTTDYSYLKYDCLKYLGGSSSFDINSYGTNALLRFGPSTGYCIDCPICSKIGCVPGCCDCLPGSHAISMEMQKSSYFPSDNNSGQSSSIPPYDPCLEAPASPGGEVSTNTTITPSAPPLDLVKPTPIGFE